MAGDPSVRSTVRADQIAVFALLFAPVCLVMAALAASGWLPDFELFSLESPRFVGPEAAPVYFAMAVVTLLAGAGTLQWRVAKIRNVFAAGGSAPGVITKFTKFKDRGYLHYRFPASGQDVETHHFVHLAAHVKRIEVGQKVTVRFDPASPRNAFVAEVFGLPE